LGVGATPVMVIRPLFCAGEVEFRSVSMNSKSFGNGAQTNGLMFPGVLLTRSILIWNNVPDPLNGVTPSFEKAETRKVRSEPGPGKVFADTVQPLPVRPAA